MHPMMTIDESLDFVDFEAINVTGATPQGLTATKIQPTGKRKRRTAVIYVYTAAIVWRSDPNAANLTGTSTDANCGPSVAAGSTFTVRGHNNLSQLRFLAPTGTAYLKVHYTE